MSRTLEKAYIPIDQIHADWTLNPCERDDAHILNLASHIHRDGYNEDYPLIVFRIKGQELLQLTCGFHRFEASQVENPDFPKSR